VRCLDVSVVTFRPDLPLLEKLIASLAEQAAGQNVSILIHDNSPDAETTSRIAALPLLQPGEGFVRVDVRHSPTNVGFGRGHNANAARCTAPFLFILNQDCIVEPGALGQLLDFARNDERRVAAWELRQIPYEHPKAYDPVTLDVPWVSGAPSTPWADSTRRFSCTAKTSICHGDCERKASACAICRSSPSFTGLTSLPAR
jgi:GT2 family glycosyltransferase